MRKRLIICLILGLFVVLPFKVYALDGGTLSCDKAKIAVGESLTCSLVGNSTMEVSSLSGKVKVSDSLKLEPIFNVSDIWLGDVLNGDIQLYTDNNKTGNFDIVTFKVTALKKDLNAFVSIEDLIYYGNHSSDDSKARDVSIASFNLEILSSDNTLKSLTVSEGKLEFDPSLLDYEVNVSNDVKSITINALANDSNSIMSGDIGTFLLDYGENSFAISVTSEAGLNRVYHVTVIREDLRSSNGDIKNLIFKNYSINVSKGKYEYELNLKDDLSRLELTNIVLEDSNASVKAVKAALPVSVKEENGIYIFENIQTGNNLIQIEVEAHNKIVTTYSITVIRGKKEVSLPSDDNVVEVPDTGSNIFYIFPIAGVVLVALGIFMVFYIKKRKKQDN